MLRSSITQLRLTLASSITELRTCAAALLVAALAFTPIARSAAIDTPIFGVTRIVSPEGFERILLPLTFPTDLDHVALGDVHLRVPKEDLAFDRTLDLFVGAIATPWTPGAADWTLGWRTPGGDIDPGLRSRVSVAREMGADLFIDLSAILRAGQNDVATYGILLSVPERDGIGFDAETAAALANALSRARVEVVGRAVPGERVLFNKDGYVPPDED